MGRRLWYGVVIVGIWAAANVWISSAWAQEFYKGKTIRMVVATTPGGGFDAYSRALARHMGKHIPGNPTFVVENMPGAGFLIGTNFLYNQAKPDGLTIGNWIRHTRLPGCAWTDYQSVGSESSFHR